METSDATEMIADGVTLNGRMTECYGLIKEYGFYYGTDVNAREKVVAGGNEYVEKAFSKSISGLEPGKYFFKAFATNATATGYGPLQEFIVGESGDDIMITVKLDGKYLDFDAPPMLVSDRTLVPLRVIFEALGADVQWYGESQTVKAIKDDTEIALVVGGKAYINGQLTPLDVPAMIVNDRTLIPLRFVSEAMGCQVNWIGATRTVIINSNP